MVEPALHRTARYPLSVLLSYFSTSPTMAPVALIAWAALRVVPKFVPRTPNSTAAVLPASQRTARSPR